MFRKIYTVAITSFMALSIGLGGVAQAQSSRDNLAFSADAVQVLSDGNEQVGKIYRAGPNMRLDFQQEEQNIIQIFRKLEGIMILLDAESETYAEIHGPPLAADAIDGPLSPCPPQSSSQGVSCERAGQDVVSGVTVERWVISSSQQNGSVVVLWDTGRHRALQFEYPDGSYMKMAFVKMEEVSGRNVEYWAITQAGPTQELITGGWWFDPELRVVIREDLPNGVSRRIENIEVGPIDPALFAVPEGWTQISPQELQTPVAPADAQAGSE